MRLLRAAIMEIIQNFVNKIPFACLQISADLLIFKEIGSIRSLGSLPSLFYKWWTVKCTSLFYYLGECKLNYVKQTYFNNQLRDKLIN